MDPKLYRKHGIFGSHDSVESELLSISLEQLRRESWKILNPRSGLKIRDVSAKKDGRQYSERFKD